MENNGKCRLYNPETHENEYKQRKGKITLAKISS